MDGNYIGLMSGTSADSIDAVVVSISNNNLTLLASHTEVIPEQIQNKIWSMNTVNNNELQLMLELDHQLGKLFSTAVNNLLLQASLTSSSIIAIGCHGQTVRHYPNSKYPTTLQIADANLIVDKTKITTVSDFRRADIAAGGQGAPLVPAFHQYQFQDSKYNRVIINIGGIANISYLPKDPANHIIGFDTGPGNCLMDDWIQENLFETYDINGDWAQSGKIDENLLSLFMEHPYFKEQHPKSTGRDVFNLNWIKNVLQHYKSSTNLNPEDIQITLLAVTAYSIYNSISSLNDVNQVYVCGGGIKNATLIKQLNELLSDKNIHCKSTHDLGIAPDWVEACAFAWLAYQRIENLPGNCPSVTGATHDCILGAVYTAL